MPVALPAPVAAERPYAKLFLGEGFDRVRSFLRRDVPPSAGALWCFLSENCERSTNALVAPQEVLADALKVDVRTIRRATAKLVELGAVVVFKVGTANCYALNPREVMRRREDHGRYWAFDARALIGRAENEAIMVKLKQAFPQSWDEE